MNSNYNEDLVDDLVFRQSLSEQNLISKCNSIAIDKVMTSTPLNASTPDLKSNAIEPIVQEFTKITEKGLLSDSVKRMWHKNVSNESKNNS